MLFPPKNNLLGNIFTDYRNCNCLTALVYSKAAFPRHTFCAAEWLLEAVLTICSGVQDVSKQWVIGNFCLIDKLYKIRKSVSSSTSFLDVICTTSPSFLQFVWKFRQDALHVGGIVHFIHVIHIIHCVATSNQEQCKGVQSFPIF